MKDILVIFASPRDKEIYEQVLQVLDEAKAGYDFRIASAHKTPDDVDVALMKEYKVIISGAGLAAALPGVIAAKNIRPVIGVPCRGSYEGLDALLTIMQMPSGIPVLGVGVGNGTVAAQQALSILKNYQHVVLVGDKTQKAFSKAERILKEFGVNHTHSDTPVENAINIAFVYFDEPLPKKNEVVIYCPLVKGKDTAEAALNLLKHSDHGMWVGLNNGTNAALAAVEVLNINNAYEEKLTSYRNELKRTLLAHNK